MVKSINEALKVGKTILEKNNIEIREARLLLALAMHISHSELIRYNVCDDEEYITYLKYVERRVNGEPFAYIAGEKEFMKLSFIVTPDVLIPREDTEILVIESIKQNKKKILDLCTGSGCIAISLAKYIENADVTAVDICQYALEIAKKNAKRNDVKVNFIESNLFENVFEKYDAIVSNPPYIKTSDLENLQIEVKNEPRKALDGGEDGLYFYREIIIKSKEHLNYEGVLLFEIGYDEADDVVRLFRENGYVDVKVIKDLSGNDRVVYAKKG